GSLASPWRSGPNVAVQNRLLMMQRLNRIQTRGTTGRQVSEQHTDSGRERECQEVDLWIEDEGNLHELGKDYRSRGCDEETDQTAQGRQSHRFDKKLQQYFAFECSDGESCSDLSGSLRD